MLAVWVRKGVLAECGSRWPPRRSSCGPGGPAALMDRHPWAPAAQDRCATPALAPGRFVPRRAESPDFPGVPPGRSWSLPLPRHDHVMCRPLTPRRPGPPFRRERLPRR